MNARARRTDGATILLCRSGGPGARGSSIAGDPPDRQHGARSAAARVRSLVRPSHGSTLDFAREAAAGHAAAGLLLYAFRAPADGAPRVRFAVSLVCWA